MTKSEVAAAMIAAEDALRTPGHEASGHNLVDPARCKMCVNNALADRLDLAVDALNRGTLVT